MASPANSRSRYTQMAMRALSVRAAVKPHAKPPGPSTQLAADAGPETSSDTSDLPEGVVCNIKPPLKRVKRKRSVKDAAIQPNKETKLPKTSASPEEPRQPEQSKAKLQPPSCAGKAHISAVAHCQLHENGGLPERVPERASKRPQGAKQMPAQNGQTSEAGPGAEPAVRLYAMGEGSAQVSQGDAKQAPAHASGSKEVPKAETSAAQQKTAVEQEGEKQALGTAEALHGNPSGKVTSLSPEQHAEERPPSKKRALEKEEPKYHYGKRPKLKPFRPPDAPDVPKRTGPQGLGQLLRMSGKWADPLPQGGTNRPTQKRPEPPPCSQPSQAAPASAGPPGMSHAPPQQATHGPEKAGPAVATSEAPKPSKSSIRARSVQQAKAFLEPRAEAMQSAAAQRSADAEANAKGDPAVDVDDAPPNSIYAWSAQQADVGQGADAEQSEASADAMQSVPAHGKAAPAVRAMKHGSLHRPDHSDGSEPSSRQYVFRSSRGRPAAGSSEADREAHGLHRAGKTMTADADVSWSEDTGWSTDDQQSSDKADAHADILLGSSRVGTDSAPSAQPPARGQASKGQPSRLQKAGAADATEGSAEGEQSAPAGDHIEGAGGCATEDEAVGKQSGLAEAQCKEAAEAPFSSTPPPVRTLDDEIAEQMRPGRHAPTAPQQVKPEPPVAPSHKGMAPHNLQPDQPGQILKPGQRGEPEQAPSGTEAGPSGAGVNGAVPDSRRAAGTAEDPVVIPDSDSEDDEPEVTSRTSPQLLEHSRTLPT